MRLPRALQENVAQHLPSSSFAVGLGSAVLGSVAVGAIVGPVGVGIGIALGVAAGFATGRVLDKEERKRIHRTRELDDIIGVTSGSLGAASSPALEQESSDEEALPSGREWIAEWLTPPPPQAV